MGLIGLAGAAWADRAWAKPGALPTVGLSIGIAHDGGQPVVAKAWADQQVAEAQRLLQPHGVFVRSIERRELPAATAHLKTPADRDRLAAFVKPRVVNVFLVRALKDIDRENRYIQGVRWRQRKNLRNDWVIVAANATPTTLAHELGHFFGLGHSRVVNNIMCYERTDPAAVKFDLAQGRRMRRNLAWQLRSKRLQPVTVTRGRK